MKAATDNLEQNGSRMKNVQTWSLVYDSINRYAPRTPLIAPVASTAGTNRESYPPTSIYAT